MEEELKINKEPNITRPDLPNYVGPDEGKAEHTVGPLEVAAGAVIAPGLVMKAAKAWGVGRVLDAGMQIAFPDAEDTKLEQALEFNKPIKTGIKATRLMYENVLKDADVYSKSRFSSRLKREAGKKIIDDYLQKKVVEGPHKAWQDQNIPQTELSKDISDLSKKHDIQYIDSGSTPIGYGSNYVPPNASQVYKQTQKLLNEHVLVGPGRVFDYGAFRALFTGNKRGRLLEGWMQTTPHFKIANWNTHRQELVDVFESIYGDVMQAKGITRKKIQIDHLVTLRSTMPVYDGVAYGSPLWNSIQETFLRRPNRYNPGNTLDNLDALDPGSHTIKTNFFNKRIGKDGELFFTPEKLEYMKASDANRMEVLNEFLDIQDEGTLILREAMGVWESLYKIDSTEMPVDIFNRLSNIPIGEFTHPELENLDELRAIITEIITDETFRASEGLKDLSKTVKEGIELEDYSSGVRQVQQDTDPAELLPKPRRVISNKQKLQKQLTKEDIPINPDQPELPGL